MSDREIVTIRLIDAPPERGVWRFARHGPDGASYGYESVFVEVMKRELIVFQHVSPRSSK
jgi:uncharacterized protein YndB with AHSA1/START domain